jgi:hypothetical protein
MHPKPDSARQEIFSSVKNLQAQGVNVGPVGIELSLEERGDRVIATFRDYAGSSNPIKTTKLQGTLEESGSECKISFCLGATVTGKWKSAARLESQIFEGLLSVKSARTCSRRE